jgi:hypothetical protein
MKCIIRKGYAYYWLGQDRLGGAVVDITEEEYKKKNWIFEPPEYAAKVLAKPEPEVKQEEAAGETEQPEPEVQQEVVEEGIVNSEVLVKPKTVRRKK